MNKVLFPSSNPALDFATAGGNVGWVPVQNNVSLASMASNIIETNVRIADHAIPSPVAHVKDFYTKLNSGDEDAVNEWRGMLAVIALQDLKSINITIRQITIYDDPSMGTPSMLGKIICDALTENPQITGYKFLTQTNLVNGTTTVDFVKDPSGNKVPEYKTLSVFCKDGVPFAMFMPGMVICPFKDYPKTLFEGLEWYNAKSDKWLDVREVISPSPVVLSVTAQKLYYWVNSMLTAHNDNNLLAYKNYILGTCPVPAVNPANNPIPKPEYASYDVWNELKTVCPPPQGAPREAYSEKLFIILPPDRHFQGVTDDKKDYAIEKGGFSPKVKQVNNRFYYIIPPIHHDVVECLRSGAANFVGWDIIPTAHDDNYTFEFNFTLNFAASGEIMTYKKVYNNIDVVYTDSMPYISLWPFVDFAADDWKEHFVSVWSDTLEVSRRGHGHYASFVKGFKKLSGYNLENDTTPQFKVSLVALRDNATVDNYECASAFRNKSFTMLKSNSQPFALEFTYAEAGNSYYIGSWIIDRSGAQNINPAAFAKTFYVAMDFGTTSTNVFMREDVPGAGPSIPTSISSAGKFLYDVYNPYIDADNYNRQKLSDFIQNYYLFSSKVGPIGKIFTYGQNFTVKKNGVVSGDIESNISGRAVVVDEQFIIAENNGDSGIYNGLKLYKKEQPEQLKRAAHNFILNLLTYAVLEAKVNGATTVTLRVSYPTENKNFGGMVINYLDAVQASLQQKSGMTINIQGTTEACAAGEYFTTFVADAYAPVPSEGYGVIDIGGGTSDFSYWRQPYGGKLEMKAEHSFGYAGKDLVVKTMVQAIKNNSEFINMWQVAPGSAEDKAIKKYTDTEVTLPLSDNYIATSHAYKEKTSALDFILENAAVNVGMLGGDCYSPLFSTMRIKYYSLFYLIAKFMKAKIDKGEINLSDLNTKICLAGCGSKGIKLCSVGDIGSAFMSNLEEMMKIVIGLTNVYPFGITAPATDKKEEVVFGLTITSNAKPLSSASAPAAAANAGSNAYSWGANSQASVPAAPVAAPAAQTTAASPLPRYDVNALSEAYQQLIAMLSHYEQNSGDGTHLLDRISFVNKITGEENATAIAYFTSMLAHIQSKMYEANCDRDTYLEHFSLLMLDAMIDRFI